MNGLNLTPERIAELQRICEALSAPRSGSDSGEHDWRRFYAHAQHAFPLALSDLATLHAKVNALAAWQCEKCGARFEKKVDPRLMEGVTSCSACVENEVLHAENARLRAIVDKLPKTADGVPVVPWEESQVWVWRMWPVPDHRRGPAWRESTVSGFDGCTLKLFDGMQSFRAIPSDCYSTPEAAEAARAKGGA